VNTRLTLAVLASALALGACDESANKPVAAAHPAGGIAGPKSAGAAPTSATGNKTVGTPDSPKPASPVSAPRTAASGTAAGPRSAPGLPAPSASSTPVPAATSPEAPKPQTPPATPTATPPTTPPDGVLKHTETDSGLIIDDLKFGEGAVAQPHQTVVINYRGTLADGTEFDSSYKNGQPATFPLDNLIKGWQEGIPGMKVGSKRRLIVPPELGYGKREIKGPNGQVLIPANSMLIFEIELVGVK